MSQFYVYVLFHLKDPKHIAESYANEWEMDYLKLEHFIIKETVDADSDKADVQHYAFFTEGSSFNYLGVANQHTVCLQDKKGILLPQFPAHLFSVSFDCLFLKQMPLIWSPSMVTLKVMSTLAGYLLAALDWL